MKLTRDDVKVMPLEPEWCSGCVDGLQPAEYGVWLELRTAGIHAEVGRFCRTCADDMASRIREGLKPGRR